MKNNILNKAALSIIIVLCFIACDKSKEIDTNNHKTSEVTIHGDSLALYITYDSLINVENIISSKKIYQTKINNGETTIPTILIEKNNCLYFPVNETILSCVDFRTKKNKWIFKCEGTIRSLKNANNKI